MTPDIPREFDVPTETECRVEKIATAIFVRKIIESDSAVPVESIAIESFTLAEVFEAQCKKFRKRFRACEDYQRKYS
jgi:hypothetical protein